MDFAIIIQHDKLAAHALRFCHAVLKQGHRIRCLFFTGLPVLQLSKLNADPSWQSLCTQHQLDIYACVNSAEQYGVETTLIDGAHIAGLTTFAANMQEAERVVNF